MGWVKDSKSWFEKTIQRNIADPVKAAGRNIDNAIFKPIGEATGLRSPSMPDSAKLQLDPNKTQAMADYGQMINKQSGQFNPAAYGPGYFQARQANPQFTSNTHNMPGIYSPGAAIPNAPGQIATPQQQQVSGDKPDLRNITTGNMANTYTQEAALKDELAKLSRGQTIEQGYDPAMRDKYIQAATSGLEKQKQDALARLKEDQMKAGNYGSSVGQKATSDLMAEYDRQMMEATNKADLMQMEASREDRYRNIGVDQTRTGLLTNVAGAGANVNLASTGFNRDTTSMQNQVEMIKADYARQGKQIDNDTAIRLAGFAADQQQTQFGNQIARTGAVNDQSRMGYESQWNRYNAQNAQNQRSDATANQAKYFNIGQQDTADVRGYGMYQDVARNLAGYGANSVNPQSELNYNMWLQQEQARRQNASNAFNLATAFI